MNLVLVIFSIILILVLATISMQLWKGNLQSFIAKPDVRKKATYYPEGTQKTGQRVSWVLAISCFAIATYLMMEMSVLASSDVLLQTSIILNTVALIGYCASIVWTTYAYLKEHDGKFSWRDDSSRVIVLLLAVSLLLGALTLLFS